MSQEFLKYGGSSVADIVENKSLLYKFIVYVGYSVDINIIVLLLFCSINALLSARPFW